MDSTTNTKVMNKCFWMVANFLLFLAKKTKLTYNEINIILYYLIIPLTWCILLDLIIKLPIFTIGFILLWAIIFIVVGKSFSQWCDRIFVLSQQFIKLFGDYIHYSVVICVIVPLIIYLILFMFIT